MIQCMRCEEQHSVVLPPCSCGGVWAMSVVTCDSRVLCDQQVDLREKKWPGLIPLFSLGDKAHSNS